MTGKLRGDAIAPKAEAKSSDQILDECIAFLPDPSVSNIGVWQISAKPGKLMELPAGRCRRQDFRLFLHSVIKHPVMQRACTVSIPLLPTPFGHAVCIRDGCRESLDCVNEVHVSDEPF